MKSEIKKYFDHLSDGCFDTVVEGVRIFRFSSYVRCSPAVYPASIIVLLSGHKQLHFEDQVYTYDSDNYLVVSMMLPAVCETFASEAEPVLGFAVELDIRVLRELIDLMDVRDRIGVSEGISGFTPLGPSPMDESMKSSCMRLLDAIVNEVEGRVLGSALTREVIYRALCGSRSDMLLRLASHSGSIAKVSDVIRLVQENYSKPIDVEALASKSNLSLSSFYRLFKSVTSDTPIQYIKKLRLNRARELIVRQNVKVYVAALEVGYESVSQFSREFKRYFGETPASLRGG